MGVFATEFWRRGLRPVKGSRIVLPFPVARGRALVFPARMPDSHRLLVRYRLRPQGRSYRGSLPGLCVDKRVDKLKVVVCGPETGPDSKPNAYPQSCPS